MEACDVLNIIREKNRLNPQWINRNLYRLLYNPTLHIMAYERLKSKPGNMTPGTDEQTLDGFSMETIETYIQLLREEQYQPTPVRRKNIPKSKGGYRPLGVPSPRDKIIQEGVRLILEAIYEPNFHEKRGDGYALVEQPGCQGMAELMGGDLQSNSLTEEGEAPPDGIACR